MLIKGIDSKSHIIKSLKALLSHPEVYDSVRERIKKEIYRINKGYDNEKDAAYYIDHYFAHRKNWFVIHDLRLELKGIKVNIDHLLIGRFRNYILESKYFSSPLMYSNGNFSIKTTRGYIGIPNPILQAERQIDSLIKIVRGIGIESNISMNYDYYVLLSPRVYVSGKLPEKIIKADMVGKCIDKDIEESGFKNLIKDTFSLISTKRDELEAAARKLVSYHKAWDIELYLKRLNIVWAKKLLS